MFSILNLRTAQLIPTLKTMMLCLVFMVIKCSKSQFVTSKWCFINSSERKKAVFGWMDKKSRVNFESQLLPSHDTNLP
jgi:hypothetical protein